MKKGTKCWTIRMDRNALYEVVPCTFQETQGDTSYYKIAFEVDGRTETMVVDIKEKDIFRKRRDAIVACVTRCHEVAHRHLQRALELANPL